MDKYEYKIRSDEIRSLIGEGRYAEAVRIADTIDWNRVKNVSMLCMISDLYKINRRFEESRDVLLMAYERNPSGRAIVYSLCELAIKMGEFVQAVEYYKEFVRIAPRDDKRYILQYKLYEAQDVGLEERIAVLQEYKRHDYQERWGYELAYLYHRVGLVTECVEECDDVFLWFGDGRYVMKALELKALHEPLSPEQLDRYNRYQVSIGATVQLNTPVQPEVMTMVSPQQEEPEEAPVLQEEAPLMSEEEVQMAQEPEENQALLLQSHTTPLGKGAAKALIQSVIMPQAQDGEDVFAQIRAQGYTMENAPTQRIITPEIAQAPTKPIPAEEVLAAEEIAEEEDSEEVVSEEMAEELAEALPEESSGELADTEEEPAAETPLKSEAEAPADPEDFFSPEGGFLVPTADVSNFNTVNLQKELAENMRKVMEMEAPEAEADEPMRAFDPHQAPIAVGEHLEQLEQSEQLEAPEETLEFFDTGDLAEPQPVSQEVFFSDTAEQQPVEMVMPEAIETEVPVQPETQVMGFIPFTPQETPVIVEEPPIHVSMAEQLRDKRLAASIAATTVEQTPLYKGSVYTDEPLQEEVPGAVIRPNVRYQNAQYDKLLMQDYDGQIRMALRDERSELEKQITGQISIEEYVKSWESYKLKQQEKQLESVRTRVMTETGDMLAEYDEETRRELQRLDMMTTAPQADRVTPEKDELEIEDIRETEDAWVEEKSPVPFDTSELEQKSIEARLEQEVITAIAEEMETEAGKPVFEESMEALQTTIVQSETMPEAESAGEEDIEPAIEEIAEVVVAEAEAIEELAEAPETAEAGTPAEASVAEEMEQASAEDEETPAVKASAEETAAVEEVAVEESAVEEPAVERAAEEAPAEETAERSEAPAVRPVVQAAPAAARLMTPEEKEIFGPYINQKSSRDQIVRAIDSISMAAYTDNVIITGDQGAGTVPLAKGLIRAAESSDANFSGQVAKIAASALNRREVSEILAKLEGGALIVQSAADLKPATVNVLLKLLENENKGIIVVMEDTRSSMEQLLSTHPELRQCFNVRVDIEALDSDALVSYAKEYALEKEYSIDNLGVLALHTRIAENQRHDHAVTVTQVREFVDQAIRRANRHTLGHFFDVLFGKRYDEEDMIILRERDFIYA